MNLLTEVPKILAAGENLVMALIIERSGSAPRKAGTRMVVRKDGSCLGTIGGGILEARVIELAAGLFDQRGTCLLPFVFSPLEAGSMGMLCGGRILVMLHHVDATDESQGEIYRCVASSLEKGKPACLITVVPTEGESTAPPPQAIHDGRNVCATAGMEPRLVEELMGDAPRDAPRLIEKNGKRYFLEPLVSGGAVMIFGAGHISRHLAPLTRKVGFHTTVLDDREDFAHRRHFPTADRIVVLESFHAALDGLPINENTCLVIVTRGHAHDKGVLGQALSTRAGYIGMIGSLKKRDAIYAALAQEGFTDRDLERVHCPVGLPIGAETPEEIAVSITAELIQVRAAGKP